MKSYLEVTWLVSAVMFFVCFHVSAELFQMNFDVKKTMILSFIHAVLSERLTMISIVCLIVVHVMVSFALFPGKLMAMLESGFLYLVCLSLFQHIHDAEIRHGFLYIEQDSSVWMMLCLFLIVLDRLIIRLLISGLKKADLYVPVTVQLQHQKMTCIGYIDTGNHAEAHGLPVIFVQQPFLCSMMIEVKGISGSIEFPADLAELQTERKTYKVVAAYSKDLQVECLLHSTMK